MKQLKILILILGISFYFPTYSFAYTELECTQLASKAKNEVAARAILSECGQSDSFFSKNQNLKCAIKAGEVQTAVAARALISNYCYQ
jgi:hypothetical protein